MALAFPRPWQILTHRPLLSDTARCPAYAGDTRRGAGLAADSCPAHTDVIGQLCGTDPSRHHSGQVSASCQGC